MAIKPFEPIRLAEKDKKDLVDMAGNLVVLKEEIAKAKRATVDVTDLEKKFAELTRLRDGLLREYS